MTARLPSPLALTSLLALPLLLAACGEDPAPAEDDGRLASGEVLEGSISDAMLPLDTVRSQPPLAEPEPGEGDAPGDGTTTPGTDAPATDDAAASEAAPATAEEEPVPPASEP